jgi:hypothetical protein
MTITRFWERGDPGVFLTTSESGNTSDGGDIPMTVVSPSDTAAIIYDQSPANEFTADTSILFDNTTGVREIRKTLAASSVRHYWYMLFQLKQLPGSISIMGSIRNAASTTSMIEMRISSGNQVCLNANGTTFDTAATALNTTDIYLWEVWAEQGASITTGKAKHRLRKSNADGTWTSVHNGALFTDKNTGAAGDTADSLRWGKLTSASTAWLRLLQHGYDDGAVDYAPDPPTGICGTDVTVEPWTVSTLTAVGRGSWTQLSGAAVTLGGSGNTRTYTAPADFVGRTLRFGFGGDDCLNTILPATDAERIGGVITPARLRTGKSIALNGL